GHDVLADLAEAEAAVEQQDRVGAVLEEDLAGHDRVTRFGVALRVGVERAAHAATAAAAGDDHAVDVEEVVVALAEPAEVARIMRAVAADADQEAGEVAVALGDAEVLGGLEEVAQPRRVQREDRGACSVVEGQDGIQLVLAHVADDDRHSDLQGGTNRRGCDRGDYRMGGSAAATAAGPCAGAACLFMSAWRRARAASESRQDAVMIGPLNHTRLLRWAGLFTWAITGVWLVQLWLDPRAVDELLQGGGHPFGVLVARWTALYLSFGIVYWWISRDLGRRRHGMLDNVALLVLTACAIGVSVFSGSGLGSVLLMVMAGLLPWLVPVRSGVAWLVGSNLAAIPVWVSVLGFPLLIAAAQSLLYAGFSSFVFVTALVARQQTEAREEQRRLNAELRATRRLLAESARVNERTRISRELHDLLGHHLTALSLNLEVAGH